MATPLLQQIKYRLGSHVCFYVTRDIERALEITLDGSLAYFIITNASDYARSVAAKNPNVVLVENDETLDTWQLLEHPETKKRMRPGDFVMVFKNTTLIESICKKNNWQLLNPSAELANKVEEKISQIYWLRELAKYLPPHEITTAEKVIWNNQKFILQFNRAHTGTGTLLVESEQQLREIQSKFPQREVRVTKFINGPVFTSNNVVVDVSAHASSHPPTPLIGGNRIPPTAHNNLRLSPNISYQITGLQPFTDLPFATIGNDWSLPHKLLSSKQKNCFTQIVTDIGRKLHQDGWRGLFGVDIIMDEQTGHLYLLEINARQPASTTYESELQSQREGYENVTTFETHLASLLGINLGGYEIQLVNNGAQIIYRVPGNGAMLSTDKLNPAINNLRKLDLNVIQYNNKKPGSDLLRIQSKQGIMKNHCSFNATGVLISELLDLA